ncbi:hypothetical protein DFP72DRAFT_884386 [Ephemerocybe angulata]|uniref:SRPBCC domain-containing protein n=1 Tax=Ephemerocybe angulata TaxID=980116 RepID=A0A8H6I775_9AGAR|nr:hypothetical protein DFP72DRAFT_884386 [Tulosesus angulatus]
MPRATRLPPLASDGVFAVSSTSTINASRAQVWGVIMDFAAYEQWNPFVRKQSLVDASFNPLPDNDTTPAEGKFLAMTANIPPTMGNPGLFGSNGAYCEITVLDTENYRAAWETAPTFFRPGWLLHSERWQILTELPGGKTKYETIEVFFGPMAYIVKLVVGTGLKAGFQAFADSLKERAEAIAASST